MGSCGCSGGMKDGMPCNCASCSKKYNRQKKKRRGMRLTANSGGVDFRTYNRRLGKKRRIDGQEFFLLPAAGTGMGGYGPYDNKTILKQRAERLRLMGYNARVIPLSKGHTLWITNKIRFSQDELNTARKALGPNDQRFKSMLEIHRAGGGSYRGPTPSQTGRNARNMAIASSPMKTYNKEYYEINYSGDAPALMDPRMRGPTSGEKAYREWWDMLEVLWPSYWMGNSSVNTVDGIREGRRSFVNSYEGDIAGGYTIEDGAPLPSRQQLTQYLESMPDSFETFMMSELTNHTTEGDFITTQYARIGMDSPSATYVSKQVIVGDPETWITADDFGTGVQKFKNGRKYNHLQWWVPGNLKIIDDNTNAIDDRVE